jgi:methylase of polypeptide subunit release factors
VNFHRVELGDQGRAAVSISNDVSMQARWDAAYEMPRFTPGYPHEKIVRWSFRNLPRERVADTKVLDLGCGSGRHSSRQRDEAIADSNRKAIKMSGAPF